MKGLSLKLPRLDDLVSGSVMCEHGQTSNPGTPEGWPCDSYPITFPVHTWLPFALCSKALHPTNPHPPPTIFPTASCLFSSYSTLLPLLFCIFLIFIFMCTCIRRHGGQKRALNLTEFQAAGQLQGAEVTLLMTSHVFPFVSTECQLNNPSLTHSVEWKAGIGPQLHGALALRNSGLGEASLRTEDTPPHLIVPICTGPPQAYHLLCLS